VSKLNIGNSFKSKKFKYGGYAAVLTAIVIAVVIVLNLVVDQLNLKLDLSQKKMFSLSEQTVGILKELKTDVKIIGLYETGKENLMVKEILSRYNARTNKIKVEYVDPVLHPQYARQYTKPGESVSQGSIIVTSGNKHRIISGHDLYNYSFNQQTFQQTRQSLAAEQRLTGAIMYVTSDKNPVVFSLKGHNEESLPYEIIKMMEDENYTFEELNLVSGEWKYESGDILSIVSPKRDISPEELKKINDFLAAEGRLVLLMDYVEGDMPNLAKLLETYGVNVQKALVLEGEARNMVQNKWFLLPDMKDHSIVNPLTSARLPVIIPYAQPISEIKVRKSSIKIEPLLSTSNKAYGRVDTSNQTLEKIREDMDGPFNVAVAITDKLDESNPNKTAKMIVITSSGMLNSAFTQASNGGNIDFFMNSMNWLVDKEENVSIRPKSLAVDRININMAQALIISGLVVIVIPLLVAISGIIVWLRRRHL
jgi:ABC-2 type transport system permease protein